MRFRAFGIAHCGAQILRCNNALRASACTQMKSKSRKLCKLEGSFLRRFFLTLRILFAGFNALFFYAREFPKTLQKSPFFLRIFKKNSRSKAGCVIEKLFRFFLGRNRNMLSSQILFAGEIISILLQYPEIFPCGLFLNRRISYSTV